MKPSGSKACSFPPAQYVAPNAFGVLGEDIIVYIESPIVAWMQTAATPSPCAEMAMS
jgi:hypothetical protein